MNINLIGTENRHTVWIQCTEKNPRTFGCCIDSLPGMVTDLFCPLFRSSLLIQQVTTEWAFFGRGDDTLYRFVSFINVLETSDSSMFPLLSVHCNLGSGYQPLDSQGPGSSPSYPSGIVGSVPTTERDNRIVIRYVSINQVICLSQQQQMRDGHQKVLIKN